MALYSIQLIIIVVLGVLVADIYVHQIAHNTKGTKYSYFRFGVVYVLTLLLGVGLVLIDDPYGDAPIAVLVKVATALVSIVVAFRLLRRREGT